MNQQSEDLFRDADGKFPPLGSRGYNTRSRGVRYGLAPAQAAFAQANACSIVSARRRACES